MAKGISLCCGRCHTYLKASGPDDHVSDGVELYNMAKYEVVEARTPTSAGRCNCKKCLE